LSLKDLTGGYRLHSLAEPHLVGEQRASVKGQMRGTFPLIRQERQFDDVEVGLSCFNRGQELRP
jgi:hypothetical protein